MNKVDADKRGIKAGDIIKIWNDRGTVLCITTITDRIIPGVVHSYESGGGFNPQGDPGDPKTVDKSGTMNLLTSSHPLSKNCYGMAPGSCLVQVQKWEGEV